MLVSTWYKAHTCHQYLSERFHTDWNWSILLGNYWYYQYYVSQKKKNSACLVKPSLFYSYIKQKISVNYITHKPAIVLELKHIYDQLLLKKEKKIRLVNNFTLSFLHSQKGYFVQVSGVFQPPEVLVAPSATVHQKAGWLQLLTALLK